MLLAVRVSPLETNKLTYSHQSHGDKCTAQKPGGAIKVVIARK